MVHQVSKEGVWHCKKDMKAVAKFAPPQTYTEIWAFLGLVGHYWCFIKGFTCIAQPLYKHLSGEGSSMENEHVTPMEDVLGASEVLKKACLEAHVLSSPDFNKPFLLAYDVSKLALGAVLSQKQTDGQYHLVAYTNQSLTVHEHNYHSTIQGFLALKWAIIKQFQEYLLWKSFIVQTDNNLI